MSRASLLFCLSLASVLGQLGLAGVVEDISAELNAYLRFPNRQQLVGVAIPDGGRLAWVEVTAGIANIYGAERKGSNQWLPRRLTNFSEDEGIRITGLRFAGSDKLVFNLGPEASTNPAHRAQPPSSQTLVLEWSGSRLRIIGSGAALLCITPDASTALFADSWVVGAAGIGEPNTAASGPVLLKVDLASGKAEELLRLKQGSISSAAVSPDGATVAFSSNRFDHAFVGLLNIQASGPAPAARHVVWVAPSVDSDVFPVWSLDSQRIAFLRLREHSRPDGFQRPDLHTSPLFSVMVADLAPAAVQGSAPRVRTVREVHRDWEVGYPDAEAGYGARPLSFSADGSAVFFGTERFTGSLGWQKVVAADAAGDVMVSTDRIFAVAADGPVSEACEFADWQLAADGHVYITHNCDGDQEALGIARVRSPSASSPLPSWDQLVPAVHSVAGMADIDTLVGDGPGRGLAVIPGLGVAFLRSSWQQPLEVRWLELGEKGYGTLIQGGGATAPHVQPKKVELTASDGIRSHGLVFTPPGPVRGGLLFTHGGSQRQTFAAYHYSPIYAQFHAVCQYLAASRGFVVAALNYRSGTGYGRGFRVCSGCGPHGATEYRDLQAAGLWLRDLVGFSVGVFGLSYGGLNTLQALARDSTLFAAGVASAPVFNWISQTRYDTSDEAFEVAPTRRWGFRALQTGPDTSLASPNWAAQAQGNSEVAFTSSPAGHVENLTSPLLLIHGDMDQEVAFQESLGLVRALRQYPDRVVEVLVYPEESHGLTLYASQLSAHSATAAFFERHLLKPLHQHEVIL